MSELVYALGGCSSIDDRFDVRGTLITRENMAAGDEYPLNNLVYAFGVTYPGLVGRQPAVLVRIRTSHNTVTVNVTDLSGETLKYARESIVCDDGSWSWGWAGTSTGGGMYKKYKHVIKFRQIEDHSLLVEHRSHMEVGFIFKSTHEDMFLSKFKKSTSP